MAPTVPESGTATTLTTAIDAGMRAARSRSRLASVAIEIMPAQSQPLSQKTERATQEVGGRSAVSASGDPASAPTILIHATTGALCSGARTRERANAASAPDLLALTTTRPLPSRFSARTAAAIAAALSSTEASWRLPMSRLTMPSRSRSRRWYAKSRYSHDGANSTV